MIYKMFLEKKKQESIGNFFFLTSHQETLFDVKQLSSDITRFSAGQCPMMSGANNQALTIIFTKCLIRSIGFTCADS